MVKSRVLSVMKLSKFCILGETEYWNENDFDLDDDFSVPSSKPVAAVSQVEDNCKDDEAVVWWVIAFTCTFQALHSLSSRAVAWLLIFLHAMLTLFGRWSDRIARIAQAFPSTLYRRDQYLNKLFVVPSVMKYVVCPTCLSLFKYEHCLDKSDWSANKVMPSMSFEEEANTATKRSCYKYWK